MEQMEQSFAPQYEQKEAYSPDFFAERAAEESLEKIKGDFENPESARENLAFHNSVHTERIIERTGLIINAIKEADPELVSEKTKVLGTISAAFHDTVQGWEEKNAKDGDFAKTTIGRFVGQNEKASADLGAEFMDKLNKESNMEIFSEDDKKILREAIEATVPGFDPKKGVIQPNLNENSSIVARALALADLGGAGMAGPEIFLEEGDVLFKEENLDIREALKNNAEIPDNLKNYYRQRMLGWTNFQPAFAEGRKNLLESDLNGLPETSQKKLKSLFNKFDTSIEAAKQRARNRQKMSFDELVVDMKLK